jgi:glutamyl-tRNA synthetase
MTRVRYAPSPTGDLHLGSLRTVIFDWLVARQNGGTFMLRVEDTDQSRVVPGSLERQLEALAWMGLLPEEGVTLDHDGTVTEKGAYGPYTQSKRLSIYHEHAQKLLENGHAYRCFCTPDRLDEMRKDQQLRHLPPKYDQRCRVISREESDQRAQSGERFVIRHAIPANINVEFVDTIRGEVIFNSNELDDYVLLKSDGFPTYQLASVVDDHLMEITHVLRGEEWLPSLPKNLLLYRAFGWEAPAFAHVPVILGADGKHKLSKRDGDVAVIDYREKGYLPDALFNTLTFVGWSPGTEEEFFTREELAKRFNLEKVQKSPAAFSFDRLNFVNGWYIRQLPVEEVARHMQPHLEQASLVPASWEYLLKVAGILQERFKHFDETAEISWFFFKRPEVTQTLKEIIIPKKLDWETTRQNLQFAYEFLQSHDNWSTESLHDMLIAVIAAAGKKNGEVLWPIRAALTGEPASPGAFEMLAVLGKEESLGRLQTVLAI